MAIDTLYNKYRPYRLDMVCGQEHVKLILANQVKQNRVAHTYLLAGPAGIGKTTVARIIACMVNATNGQTVDLSLDDPVVAKIMFGKSGGDVEEKDAARQRGIDEVRSLQEKVYLAPMELRNKVYIIDECQQLTAEAWGALLKILEEPPQHVIFIFCTTDPKKVPETIKTRCQCFEFRSLPYADVLAQCRHIASSERIEIDEDALRLVAISARGSLRRAIAELEMLSTSGKVTTKTVSQMLGITDIMTACQFLEGILQRDMPKSLRASSDAMSVGVPAGQFLSLVADVAHDVVMYGVKGYDSERVGHTPDDTKQIGALKELLVGAVEKGKGSKVVLLWVETLDKLSKWSVYNQQPQRLMNMAFVAMCINLKEYQKGA
jgi:DNA polymerase-3 subunit gamma/tau